MALACGLWLWRATRLDLAHWLVAPENPLTARVTVNRIWQQLFGYGIVKTSGDFGSQGEPPSHPELLDWLTVQYVEDGWDTKMMLKRLVMSATYRQTSKLTKERLAKDPALRIELVAYASDPDKSISRSRRLSLERAVSVRKVLLAAGIESTRIALRAAFGSCFLKAARIRRCSPMRGWTPTLRARSNMCRHSGDL